MWKYYLWLKLKGEVGSKVITAVQRNLWTVPCVKADLRQSCFTGIIIADVVTEEVQVWMYFDLQLVNMLFYHKGAIFILKRRLYKIRIMFKCWTALFCLL